VADFYPGLGFERIAADDSSDHRFGLDMTARDVEWPAVIRRTGAVG
jgi:hypothetical protein